jgi:uncharacterized protein
MKLENTETVPYGPPRFKRKELIASLGACLKGRVEQAFLIGSYARDEAHSGSDVDLILVTRTQRPFVERFRDFFDVIDKFCPIDLIIYTPEEWIQLRKNRSSFAFTAMKRAVEIDLRARKRTPSFARK